MKDSFIEILCYKYYFFKNPITVLLFVYLLILQLIVGLNMFYLVITALQFIKWFVLLC